MNISPIFSGSLLLPLFGTISMRYNSTKMLLGLDSVVMTEHTDIAGVIRWNTSPLHGPINKPKDKTATTIFCIIVFSDSLCVSL